MRAFFLKAENNYKQFAIIYGLNSSLCIDADKHGPISIDRRELWHAVDYAAMTEGGIGNITALVLKKPLIL